jgi:hypothetical protein
MRLVSLRPISIETDMHLVSKNQNELLGVKGPPLVGGEVREEDFGKVGS